ncbi:hypothetical protein EBB07_30560 [Paenibacillaceae bacterium]|nr:hypothetical protein EBB07_30560 [Paenibacillaceae bacterium]
MPVEALICKSGIRIDLFEVQSIRELSLGLDVMFNGKVNKYVGQTADAVCLSIEHTEENFNSMIQEQFAAAVASSHFIKQRAGLFNKLYPLG